MYRQGDVLLYKISELPKNIREKDKVLAYGETTGHKHQFIDTNVKVYENGKQQYVQALNDSELLHEEHGKIDVEKGIYEVRLQRELDLLGEVRQVLD